MKDMNKDKIELTHIYKSFLNKYTLIKINGKLLEDITVNEIEFYNDSLGKRNMTFNLNIPLDKYEIVINQNSKEKEKVKKEN